MGPPKFTLNEEKRIVNWLNIWRKNNPNELEWPLKELQKGAMLESHSAKEIRNKIRTLQKREKRKGTSIYNVLCIRPKSSKIIDRSERLDSDNSSVLNPRAKKLALVRDMFENVNPTEAFNGWFQLELHSKTRLGNSVQETWRLIVENWETIQNDLPSSVLILLKENAKGTQYGVQLFGENAYLTIEDRNDVSKNSSGDENDFHDDSSLSATSLLTPKNATFESKPASRKFLTIKTRMPSQYLIMYDWTFPTTDQLEATCEIFGATPCSKSKGEQMWPVLLKVIQHNISFWTNATKIQTWIDLLKETNIIAEPNQTKLIFFRNILPKRETFFCNRNFSMKIYMAPCMPEAMNLLFYTILYANSPGKLQDLFDDGLLSKDFEWYVWIILLKRQLSQMDNNVFGANAQEITTVDERVCDLCFNDGLFAIYKTKFGKPIIERFIRKVYATRLQLENLYES